MTLSNWNNYYNLQIKGLAFFFNPTSQELEQLIQMPLYYTGLTEKAIVAFEDNPNTAQVLSLSRDYHIEVTVSKCPIVHTWPVWPDAGFKKLPKCFQKLTK